MQHQCGELGPVAESLADLPGPVQARHSFTVADQVNQLVSANEADPDLGFMAQSNKDNVDTVQMCPYPLT